MREVLIWKPLHLNLQAVGENENFQAILQTMKLKQISKEHRN